MACDYNISFGFTYTGKSPITVEGLILSSSGVYGGRDYYTWYDSEFEYTFVIRYEESDGQWVFGIVEESGGITTLAFLNYEAADCPVDPNSPFNWFSTEEGWENVNSIIIKTEEQECFEILVWNKQCEFAQCVSKYIQLLQFGSATCEALEILKNKKRILGILNCYDIRDIPNDTTNYNIFTYQEIKNLLNY